MKEEQQKANYRNYIIEHQKNVEEAWLQVQPKLVQEYWLDEYKWFTIETLVNAHDESKYESGEFHAYQREFFPAEDETRLIDDEYGGISFKKGWLHHIHRNPHHWNYWVLVDPVPEALPMPEIYVFEMLLDWSAMSKQFNNNIKDWYADNRGKMVLHPDTVALIDHWIKIF